MKQLRSYGFIMLMSVCVLLILARGSYGWNSIFRENHRHLTDDAIEELGTGAYPDLDKYRGTYLVGDGVVEGSSDESAHKNPATTKTEWRVEPDTWEKKAKENYLKFEFETAYDFFGFCLHVIQDDSVPAHVRQCAHWVWYRPVDSFEAFADCHSHHDWAGTATRWGNYDSEGHYWSYWLDDDHDDDDGDENEFDTNDPTDPDGPDAYRMHSTWGTYGQGTWPGDNIPGNDKGADWYDGNAQDASIAYEQLYKAYLDTKTELKKFSESLPPLVKDLAIFGIPTGCPLINTETGNEISFKILENRKENVKIFMTIDAGGESIAPEYVSGKPIGLSSGTDLPWEGGDSYTWHGKLANGLYPQPDGEHTLYVRVLDEDEGVQVTLNGVPLGTPRPERA